MYEAPGDATWQPNVDTSGSFRASFYIGVDDDHKLSAARSALEAGELGPAVVTKRRGQMGEIHAYVKDFRDEADVRRVAEKLGEIGFCQSAATGTAKAKTGFIKPECAPPPRFCDLDERQRAAAHEREPAAGCSPGTGPSPPPPT
jgi:hypothetical protein